MIDFIDPKTGHALVRRQSGLYDSTGVAEVAPIVDGIPRFVTDDEDYAESFGFQWNHWHSVLSDSRSNYPHAMDLKRRSGLWGEDFDATGKSLLECGMGGGDDTEVLLTLPIAELHAFDISRSVERAAKYLSDDRLQISQASIFEIPYPAEAFDIVWCHRVLQHTPDPQQAMRCVCRMVKPGGFLFVHSYKRSQRYMQEFRYKWRPLTTRIPRRWVHRSLRWFGTPLHELHRLMALTPQTSELARRVVPFFKCPAELSSEMTRAEVIEWERMVTFDALTPRYDQPMTTEQFKSILVDEGFQIVWLFDPDTSPVIARAIKQQTPPVLPAVE